MDTTPIYGKSRFDCPYCDAFTQQDWWWLVASKAQQRGEGVENLLPYELSHAGLLEKHQEIFSAGFGQPVSVQTEHAAYSRIYATNILLSLMNLQPDTEGGTHYTAVRNLMLSQCFSCKNTAVWEGNTLIYPQVSVVPAPNEDMPPHVTEVYNEAAAVSAHSARAAGALLRLCLELLLEHLGAKGGSLNAMIRSVVKKDSDASLQKAMDILRINGNESVHPAQIRETEEKGVDKVYFWLLTHLAKSLISDVKEIDELYETLPDNAKQQIEKRDGTEKT